MENNLEHKRFLLLKNLARRINSAAEMSQIVQEALDDLLEVLGLHCASVILWDEKSGKVTIEVAAGAIDKVKMLRDFDKRVLAAMRQEMSMESIYVTFESQGPHSAFSYPIKTDGRTVGAITGLVEGHKNLSQEEETLEALGNQLGIAVAKTSVWVDRMGGEIRDDLVKSERLKAMIETAVTINHEINNPLAAVLGYVQLILSRPENLDEDTIGKLKKIETGALRIKEVTNRLLKIVEPVVVKYAGDIRMVDLDRSKTKEEQE